MADPFAGIDPTFSGKFRGLLAALAAQGVVMKPYFGVRDCVTQGRLWRQSRSAATIQAKIAELRAAGAPYLAGAIEKALPSSGPWATNAIPGYSWHQYGNAMDSVWVRDGVFEWSTTVDGDRNGYRQMAARCPAHGLTSLLSIGDGGHVQMPAAGSPAGQYTLLQIDALMKAKFG
jgi:hypothetical protein